MDKPKAVAWFVDGEISGDDPMAAVKLRARQLCDPHYQAARRADRIGPAADVAADEAFTVDEVREMWRRSGLSGDDLDAAAHVAWELWQVEQQRK
jgi:hypothetical protein